MPSMVAAPAVARTRRAEHLGDGRWPSRARNLVPIHREIASRPRSAHAVPVTLVVRPLALVLVAVGVGARALAVTFPSRHRRRSARVGVQAFPFTVFQIFVERAALLAAELEEFLTPSPVFERSSNRRRTRTLTKIVALAANDVPPFASSKRARRELTLPTSVSQIPSPLSDVLERSHFHVWRPRPCRSSSSHSPSACKIDPSLERTSSSHASSRQRRAVKTRPIRVRVQTSSLNDVINPLPSYESPFANVCVPHPHR